MMENVLGFAQTMKLCRMCFGKVWYVSNRPADSSDSRLAIFGLRPKWPFKSSKSLGYLGLKK